VKGGARRTCLFLDDVGSQLGLFSAPLGFADELLSLFDSGNHSSYGVAPF
jgi:hypothetical protein